MLTGHPGYKYAKDEAFRGASPCLELLSLSCSVHRPVRLPHLSPVPLVPNRTLACMAQRDVSLASAHAATQRLDPGELGHRRREPVGRMWEVFLSSLCISTARIWRWRASPSRSHHQAASAATPWRAFQSRSLLPQWHAPDLRGIELQSPTSLRERERAGPTLLESMLRKTMADEKKGTS